MVTCHQNVFLQFYIFNLSSFHQYIFSQRLDRKKLFCLFELSKENFSKSSSANNTFNVKITQSHSLSIFLHIDKHCRSIPKSLIVVIIIIIIILHFPFWRMIIKLRLFLCAFPFYIIWSNNFKIKDSERIVWASWHFILHVFLCCCILFESSFYWVILKTPCWILNFKLIFQ